MAGKKTKKKAAAKKPAPKKLAPPKKAAKSAKQVAAKKRAPKKPAPKKRAPKKRAAPKTQPAAKKPAKQAAAEKPAAKKPAPKKPAPKKPAKEPIEVLEVLDVVEVVDVREAPVMEAASLKAEILAMARQLYGDRTDEELLALDPNDIDAMDPSMFYELLGEKYGVEADPDNDYFGGFGGPIKKLIAFVESRWDGKTRKDTPMPPGDWLEEYVHPETEG